MKNKDRYMEHALSDYKYQLNRLKEENERLKEEVNRGAEIVFIRENQNKTEFEIYGAKCYESWEQWGSSKEVLGDNVEDIEQWRNGNINI